MSAKVYKNFCIAKNELESRRGGLEVEHWSDNRTLSILVVQIPLVVTKKIVTMDCVMTLPKWVSEEWTSERL